MNTQLRAEAPQPSDLRIRRALTLCLETVTALGIEAILQARPRAILAAAADAVLSERGRAEPLDAVPDAWLRRRILLGMAARLEPQILAELERTQTGTPRLARIREGIASCATPDRPAPGQKATLHWLDPGSWQTPWGAEGLDEPDALIAVAYATYFLQVHDEELLTIDPTGVRIRELCKVASKASEPRAWWSAERLARRMRLGWDEMCEAFPHSA